MKKFRIDLIGEAIIQKQILVWAETEEEAREKALEDNGHDWDIFAMRGDIDIEDVSEVQLHVEEA